MTATGAPAGAAGSVLRALAALLVVVVVQVAAPVPARAAIPLPIAAALAGGGQTSLVVDLGASTRTRPPAVAVTQDGVPVKARVVPVMSDGLALALVVDASKDGATTLPAWLSAAARFILEVPDAAPRPS